MADKGAGAKKMRFVVLLSGVSALIQSIVWILLPIAQIIEYTDCSSGSPTPTTIITTSTAPTTGETTLDPILSPAIDDIMNSSFGKLIQAQYLTKCETNKNNFKAEDLLIWNCAVLALSVIWLLSTILMLGGVKENTQKRQTSIYLWVWTIVTFCVWILDLALGAVFINDFTSYKIPSELMQSIVGGVMMTIAFKGFVLWAFNLFGVIYLSIYAIRLDEDGDGEDEQSSTMAKGPIRAFDDSNLEQRSSNWLSDAGSMDRPRFQNSYPRSQGEDNRGYVNSMDNSRYQQQQPLASIMKKSVADKNMQRNREPNTPSPDYSPPALRSQRQQPFRQNSDNSNYYNNPLYKR